MSTTPKRGYVDGPSGQVHFRAWGSKEIAKPIICLPPAPFSGVAFSTLAPLLCANRTVIAIDYPGYGSSDATAAEPSIQDFSDALLAVQGSLFPNISVDLLGFHTGCLVAVEAALSQVEAINQLILIDVPYFSPEKRSELLEKTESLIPLQADIEMLRKPWDFCVSTKIEHMSTERAFEMFVDHISSGSQGNRAFRAAFGYSCEQKFAQLVHKTTVIATQSMLLEPSLRAASDIKSSRLIELPEVRAAVLEKGAKQICKAVLANFS